MWYEEWGDFIFKKDGFFGRVAPRDGKFWAEEWGSSVEGNGRIKRSIRYKKLETAKKQVEFWHLVSLEGE